MYVNKCIKCGAEFETKNPKRVICPNCLYADKGSETTDEKPLQNYSSYSSYNSYSQGYGEPRNYQRTSNDGYRNNYRDRENSGYQRRDDGFSRRDNSGYNNGYQRDNRQNNYQRREGGYQRDNRQGGGYNRDNNRRQGGYRNNYASNNNRSQQRKPMPKKSHKQPRPLLISKEQLEQIEALYKTMLPLPNPDAHEVIGTHIGLEPQKVFFGINLVRQKMMLPKLPFPKRKLAISSDQMMAIKALYEPLLPLPPIGCHKIIAAQLKMDEWRVHVGIKLIRSQMGLDRWNEEREDKPADYLVAKHPQKSENKAEKTEENTATEIQELPSEAAVAVAEVPPEVVQTEEVAPEKPKRGRKPKKKEDEA